MKWNFEYGPEAASFLGPSSIIQALEG